MKLKALFIGLFLSSFFGGSLHAEAGEKEGTDIANLSTQISPDHSSLRIKGKTQDSGQLIKKVSWSKHGKVIRVKVEMTIFIKKGLKAEFDETIPLQAGTQKVVIGKRQMVLWERSPGD